LRALVDLLVRVQVFNRIGSWLTFNLTSKAARTYVDAYDDYAFFMDGNALAKSIGHAFGAPMRVIQQTFVLPVDVGEEGERGEAALRRSIERTIDFIAAISADLRAEGIQPTMFDGLFLPRDEGFLLSATRDLDGFALSAAFDTSSDAILAKVRRILTVASTRCRKAGGRVHLVKNVCAEPEDIAAMYREGATAFFALKRRLDPDGILRNEFLERLFPIELHGLDAQGGPISTSRPP
jgi:decaprenylphospho-beta-D-ribofuranose 2-oxidase